MNKTTNGYWYLEADDGKKSKQVRYLKTLVKWVRAQGDQQVCVQWFTNNRANSGKAFWTRPELTDEEICTRAIAVRDAAFPINLPARVMRADVVYVIEEH